ncbi:MAG: UDP-N-acetylmuramate dehydrogenase [Rhodospirillales bacterium]|nr:UDP-N-acetylmuramate dehydrogenase [Rhodospirillales bacterium]
MKGDLIDNLPPVRGRLTAGAALSRGTWFQVGGPAEVLFRPADREDLLDFLARLPSPIPVTVIGMGSNLLVRDGGVPGVVLRLTRGFAESGVTEGQVVADAGALDVSVAKTAAAAGLAGLEFLMGVPGTVGGAVRMNAGAYGRETKDVLLWAEAADRQGRLHRLSPTDLSFGYRRSALPLDWVMLRAAFAATPGDSRAITQRMGEIQAQRSKSQPIRSRTGGSTFKNPEDRKAWQLIDAAGCRGLIRGDAQVSEKHCNFLINHGEATAADLEGLGEEVRRRVKVQSGVSLEWEIKRIGDDLQEGWTP